MPLTANSQGMLSGQFTIPPNIPAGNKKVEFIGTQGSYAQAIFSGQGELLRRQLQQVITISERRYDPLAQTFMLNQACQLVAVELWFTAKGTRPVVLQLRTTSNGLPSQTILAETRIAASAINLSANQATCLSFASPVSLHANTEYALVLICNDAVTAVSIAELGKFDRFVNRWVTSQPYQVGVLLSSSNASSWTVHQDRDLSFRLLQSQFNLTQQAIDLGQVEVRNATDLMLLSYAERPQASANVVYELSLPNSTTVISVAEGQSLRLPAPLSGKVGLTARLTGNAQVSPVLHPGSQLISGEVASSATYISRAIPAGNNSRVRIVLDALLPPGSALEVALKGIDANDTWQTVARQSNKALDENWQELLHENVAVNESAVQIRLTLRGNSSARPSVRNLRVMIV